MANKRDLPRGVKPKAKHAGDNSPKSRPAPPEATNRTPPEAPGRTKAVPGAGVVRATADVRTRGIRTDRPDPLARRATKSSPGAERPGTTEQRPAATVARGGAIGGLSEIEAPSSTGGTAFAPATGGTGAPSPGSSGIRETSDPNYPANRKRYDREEQRARETSARRRSGSA
jgi:hypothetical protein